MSKTEKIVTPNGKTVEVISVAIDNYGGSRIVMDEGGKHQIHGISRKAREAMDKLTVEEKQRDMDNARDQAHELWAFWGDNRPDELCLFWACLNQHYTGDLAYVTYDQNQRGY